MDVNDFKGKSWKQACDLCRSQTMLVACSPDPVLREAAKLTKDHGAKAGAGYIAAVLYAEANDPLMVIATGAHFFEMMARNPKLESEARQSIINLADGVAWGTSYNVSIPPKQWPVKIAETTLCKNEGILNFILYEGLKRIDRNQNRNLIVANAVREFLNWITKYESPKKKKKKCTGRRHYNEGVVLTASVPG